MLNDPVIYGKEKHQYWPTLLLPHVGKRVIAVDFSSNFAHCGFVTRTGYIDSECFLCGPGMRPSIRGRTVGRAELFDRLLSEYPDHFEWLLWHPELL